MNFKFEIPKARWEQHGFRAADGHNVITLRKLRRCAGRGTRNRRIIKEVIVDGFERSYHATKGWRTRKAA